VRKQLLCNIYIYINGLGEKRLKCKSKQLENFIYWAAGNKCSNLGIRNQKSRPKRTTFDIFRQCMT